MALKPGTRIPDFTLPDQDGMPFSSTDLLGKKAMVLFFYPKDNSPGCTLEACSFRDRYEDFTDLGAEVIGISSDSERSHSHFSRRYKLPFRLLADTDQQVRKLFRIKGDLFNLLPGRETYVVDAKGIIRMVFNSMNAGQHMKKALEALKKERQP